MSCDVFHVSSDLFDVFDVQYSTSVVFGDHIFDDFSVIMFSISVAYLIC